MKIRKIFLILFIIICISFFIIVMHVVKVTGGFGEKMLHTQSDLIEYLNNYYYTTKGRYPIKLDISKLPAYREEFYRETLSKIVYISDGNSFSVHWKYPFWPGFKPKPNEFVLVTIEGRNGQIVKEEYKRVKEK